MKLTLGKLERLKSKKLIERLYKEGVTLKAYPLRIIYLQTKHTSNFPTQVGVSVAKRNFKHSVDRNRIKRLLRESYRKQKHTVYNSVEKPYIYMISYLAKEELPYADIETKMEVLLAKFIQKINKENDEE